MTTASRPLATALWGARFAGDWLASCYTTWGDTTKQSQDFRDLVLYHRLFGSTHMSPFSHAN